MKYNKTILGAGALAILLTVGVAATASAYQGDYTQKGPEYSPERHELMTSAFENNDYNAWKELMNDRGRVMQVVNEGNFSKFAEAHKLGGEGKYDEADVLREELGLRTRDGARMEASYGQGQGKGMGDRSGSRGMNR